MKQPEKEWHLLKPGCHFFVCGLVLDIFLGLGPSARPGVVFLATDMASVVVSLLGVHCDSDRLPTTCREILSIVLWSNCWNVPRKIRVINIQQKPAKLELTTGGIPLSSAIHLQNTSEAFLTYVAVHIGHAFFAMDLPHTLFPFQRILGVA